MDDQYPNMPHLNPEHFEPKHLGAFVIPLHKEESTAHFQSASRQGKAPTFVPEDAFSSSFMQPGVHNKSQAQLQQHYEQMLQLEHSNGLEAECPPVKFIETPAPLPPEEAPALPASQGGATLTPAKPKQKTKAQVKREKAQRKNTFEKNTQAALSMIFGLFSLLFCLLSLVKYAVIFSSIAIALALAGFISGFLSRKIAKNPMSTIGMILSLVSLALGLALFVLSMMAQVGMLQIDPMFLE